MDKTIKQHLEEIAEKLIDNANAFKGIIDLEPFDDVDIINQMILLKEHAAKLEAIAILRRNY